MLTFFDLKVGDKFILSRPEDKKVLIKIKHVGAFYGFSNVLRSNGEYAYVEIDAPVILLH